MSAVSPLASLQQRLVRYAELRPCTTAFVDARTPGSERKENFTIIGPGVAENPDQYVHISIPHGFNIGGARQPPRCVNSQHSHETAEVFVVLSGQWRFMSGEHGRDGHVDLGPGDTISLPTRAFRGFENIGRDVGFMFAVLGGDDPGRVLWAPYVFEAAREHGLVLLESGRLIDTTRESIPDTARPMPATTAADIAQLHRLDDAALANCVVRFAHVQALAKGPGVTEIPIISTAPVAMPHSQLRWGHGFSMHALAAGPKVASAMGIADTVEVVLMHSGSLQVETSEGRLEMHPGDTLSIPASTRRRFVNESAAPAVAFIVRPEAAK
jgi:mannose-6-phosphate isomerase-like protein (cupin superfamily)